jgi:hypothetical protein
MAALWGSFKGASASLASRHSAETHRRKRGSADLFPGFPGSGEGRGMHLPSDPVGDPGWSRRIGSPGGAGRTLAEPEARPAGRLPSRCADQGSSCPCSRSGPRPSGARTHLRHPADIAAAAFHPMTFHRSTSRFHGSPAYHLGRLAGPLVNLLHGAILSKWHIDWLARSMELRRQMSQPTTPRRSGRLSASRSRLDHADDAPGCQTSDRRGPNQRGPAGPASAATPTHSFRPTGRRS